jgi:hypothetical protein
MFINYKFMRLDIRIISFFFITLFLELFSVRTALASTHILSGTITQSSNIGVGSTTVNVSDANTNANVVTTISDNSGNYSLVVVDGTYNVQIIPPSGSNLAPTTTTNQVITSDTVLNFVLVPAGIVTLSGHVYDPLGNPVANQTVQLSTGTFVTTAITNLSGSYSLSVSPGNYDLEIRGNGNNGSLNIPQNYYLSTVYGINQNSMLDITIPATKVTVHVQNSSGNPISNVVMQTSHPLNNGTSNFQDLTIGGGITNASGDSSYDGTPKTDASGNVTLWLFPNDEFSNHNYIFTANPPSDSEFLSTNISTDVTPNLNLTITLQQLVTLSGHVYTQIQ